MKDRREKEKKRENKRKGTCVECLHKGDSMYPHTPIYGKVQMGKEHGVKSLERQTERETQRLIT